MKHAMVLLFAFVMLVASCGGDTTTSRESAPTATLPTSIAAADASTEITPVMPPLAEVATTLSTITLPATEDGLDIATVRDLTWTTPDVEPPLVGVDVQRTVGEEWALEVFHPTESAAEGWPVVVVFHGATSGSALGANMREVARQGAVVIAPRWAPPAWSETNLNALSAEEYSDGYWFDVGACGLTAAQQIATEYGGDPARTTVVGFSAGVHPAAWTGLGVVRNNLCPDRDPIVPPIGMVIGDAQWLFQGANWDETFLDPDSLARDTVDRFLNPQRWVDLPDEFYAFLWSSESRAWARRVENPPSADS